MNANAATIYDAVAALGLKRAQARRLLPDWWDPQIESTPGGAAELALLLGRRLSLDVRALIEGSAQRRGAAHSIAYKHQIGLDDGALSAASCIAASLAQAVAAAMHRPLTLLEPDPERLRERLRAGGAVVNFDALLDLCWNHGIPVIPMPHLPVGIRKMDGAVLGLAERPAIIIAKRKPSRAWLSFILAHEMGHIAAGHVAAGASIVDVALQEAAGYATESAGDAQETQADQWALTLLGGTAAQGIVQAWKPWADAVDLAVRAREEGRAAGIEPGHLLLRFAFTSKRWPEAQAALRFLREDVDADQALMQAMQAHLDLDAIAEDMRDLVTQITGVAA
jgi:hypothetical protein